MCPRRSVQIHNFYQYFYLMICKWNLRLCSHFLANVFIISFIFEFSSRIFVTYPIKLVYLFSANTVDTSPMMKFLMVITSVLRFDMDFVILSKLRSTFEKVFLVGTFIYSLFISDSLSESATSFSFFSVSLTILYESPLALHLLTKTFTYKALWYFTGVILIYV